jgi:TolB-like protein/DNA-binding winged helix-turn-helix (wHTH) protein/Tfp pilus assembly protein PilF
MLSPGWRACLGAAHGAGVSKSSIIYAFGPFRLDPQRQTLMRDNIPLALSARAFEVLHLLARHEGMTVSREEILTQVWRGVTVEENNLTVQISALRRTLGELADGAPVIVTVPGQGYRLAVAVTRISATAATAPADLPSPAPLPPAAPASRAWRGRLAVAAGGLGVAALLAVALLSRTQPGAPAAEAPAQAGPKRLSLVVLPFRNLGDDHKDDALADATSDDLTTEMAHMPAATVIARETADTFKGRPAATDQIGRQLNVRYVLEASLRSLGDHYSVNAQLIEAASGTHLWAERFDVKRDAPGGAQAAISHRIAGGLRYHLVQIEAARSLKERPDHPDALDCFLRAGAVWANENSRDADTQSRRLLEQAIKLDPDFTPALAELAWEISARLGIVSEEAREDDLREAGTVVAHALELDRFNADVLASEAALLANKRQTAEALATFQNALTADPDCSHALNGLWRLQASQGQFQAAFDTLGRLQLADPANPDHVFWNVHKGDLALWMGRPAEAVTLMRQGLADEPDPVPGGPVWDGIGYHRLHLAAALALSGDMAEARRIVAADNAVWPHRSVFRFAGYLGPAGLHNAMAPKILGALRAAGLVAFTDEHKDDHVPPSATPIEHDAFDPTPMTIPGIRTIDTPALAKWLLSKPVPAPLLVDMGHGLTWPPGELKMGRFNSTSAAAARDFLRTLPALKGRPVIVFSEGPDGWRSYNAALQFKAAGVGEVIWYRGGEEAWTAAGLPADGVFPGMTPP